MNYLFNNVRVLNHLLLHLFHEPKFKIQNRKTPKTYPWSPCDRGGLRRQTHAAGMRSPLARSHRLFVVLIGSGALGFTSADGGASAGADESVVDRSYVKKKLEHGLTRIWQVGGQDSRTVWYQPSAPCNVSLLLSPNLLTPVGPSSPFTCFSFFSVWPCAEVWDFRVDFSD